MACFSFVLIEQLLIWAVIFIAVFAIINLLLPMITSAAGTLGSVVNIIIAIIRIVFWAAVAIVVIIFAFEMISCLISAAPSLLPHR